MSSASDFLDPLAHSLGETADLIGSTLSAPGDYYRGFVSGKPWERVTPKEYLEVHHATSSSPTLNAIAGLGVGALTDPLALAPAVPRLIKGGMQAGQAANKFVQGLPDNPNPILSSMGHFGYDQGGYLKVPIPGVSAEMQNAMDAVGPQYPGGIEKLTSMLPQGLRSGVVGRLERLASGPYGVGIASELPEGTRFLGAGAEGSAFLTPEGSVIRISDMGEPVARPNIGHVLQPYRVAKYGPHTVEHLPRVAPLNAEVAEGIDYPFAEHMRKAISNRGPYSPGDVYGHNIGITPEGNAIVHDPGAVWPRQAAEGAEQRYFRPHPTYPMPPQNVLNQVMDAGGPQKVRESIEAGRKLGTKWQGVSLPGMRPIIEANPYLKDPNYIAPTPKNVPPYSGSLDDLFENFSEKMVR